MDLARNRRLSLALALILLLSLLPVRVMAEETRERVTEIKGYCGAWDSVKPVYGREVKNNVYIAAMTEKTDKGNTLDANNRDLAAFFDQYGEWQKKIGDGPNDWKKYEVSVFLDGTYRYRTKVMVEGKNDLYYVDGRATVSVSEAGGEWSVSGGHATDTYSLIWVYSPEIVLDSASEPLNFIYSPALHG